MNILLALDSATENCSVALRCGNELWLRENADKQQHAACLLQMVDEVLTEAAIAREQLEAIIYGQGPGSFTGVRVAVSAAQGLALGLDLPTCGVSSLAALALGALAQQQDCQYALAAIDARMGEVYLGLYARDADGVKLLAPEAVLRPEAAVERVTAQFVNKSYVTAGTGIVLLQKAGLNCTPASVLFPQPQAIMALGGKALSAGQGRDVAQAQPVYIRNEVTWKKLAEQHA